MPKKRLTAVLLILTVLLAGTAFFFLKDIDRTRPVITFTGEPVSYNEGDDVSVLLANVTAFDTHDGDLTGEIRVNQITPIDNGTRARVTYVVLDARKNIATATQIVDYTPLPEDLSDESVSDDLPEEGADGILSDEEALSQADGESEVNPEAPVLVLSTESDTIATTDTFSYMAYIASITDDVDSRETLYRNIIIEGDYSTSRIGSYPLVIYVRDSDGNESNRETFILNRG